MKVKKRAANHILWNRRPREVCVLFLFAFAHLKAVSEDTLWESIKVSVIPTKHFPALAPKAESVNNTGLQLSCQHIKPVKYISK